MKKLLLLTVLFTATILMTNAAVVTYTSDNITIFPNPERGFTTEQNGPVTTSSPRLLQNLGSSSFTSGEKANMSLMVVLYNFRKFKNKDLPEAILSGFDADMQVLRSNGWKCVLRFAYTEDSNDHVDATPTWVERHLTQLQPHLAQNADVIYVVEAGFVGVWGEWYYTSNYGDEESHLNANRRRVVNALLANVPSDRFVLFRTPVTKTDYMGDTNPLTASEAFSGSARARMGHHNDAFLNNYGDMGTYASDNLSDDPAVRQYVAAETLYVPNGGETNIDDDDNLAEARYAQGPSEMSTYHWSFCGYSYARPVTDRWRTSGLFDTLNIHMGYRYNLLDAQFGDSAAPAGKLNVTIRLRNSGYAPLYNERTVYLVLKNSNNTYSLPLGADPRRWSPNNAISAINEQVNIPENIPAGTYHLYLHLPDKYSSIAADPRYAVRLANTGVWDATTGWNDLGANVVISNAAPLEPGDLPTVIVDALPAPTDQNSRARKIFENGTLYIVLPDGTRYTLLGQR